LSYRAINIAKLLAKADGIIQNFAVKSTRVPLKTRRITNRSDHQPAPLAR